jgi:hypothetical protein
MERLHLNKLNGVQGKKQYWVEISSHFLQDLKAEVDIKRSWKTIKENIKIAAIESLCYYELKKHKIWLDQRMLKIIRSKETAKLQSYKIQRK